MTDAVNTSEQWVYDVCRGSFLSLWCYVNPQGRHPGKELCDILVVCNPHVLVISVKEVEYSVDGDVPVNRERWQRKAIDASLKQINGAIRWLDTAEHVVQKDGKAGLPLPPPERRIYHRIAVAFGGKNKVSLKGPALNPDRVPYHILDEISFDLLLKHLDTITDFVGYLGAKENLLSRARLFINGGEENLLALYLHANRAFPEEGDMLIVEGDMWDGFSGRPEFLAKLEEDDISYLWDEVIENYCKGDFKPPRWRGPELSQAEIALRVMARESRFERRVLGRAFREFLERARDGELRARRVQSTSGVGYVFFVYDSDHTLKGRTQELVCRCLAAVCGFEDCTTIVGIGGNVPGEKPIEGYSSDLVLLQRGSEPWPTEYLEQARRCRDVLGYFKTPEMTHIHADEYPDI